MKKFTAFFVAVMMAFSVVACGGNTDSKPNDTQTEQASQSAVASSLELMTTVWDAYPEADKFPVFGGDLSEENNVMDAPGVFSLSDAQAVDTTLGFPEASVSLIDDAASLVHMMNANTFTGAAYHVSDQANVASVTEAIKENILARQWLCGFPDQLVIVTIDQYVVAFFGEAGIVETFKNQITTSYPDAVVACEESLI